MSAAAETQYKLAEPILKTCNLFTLLAGHVVLGLSPGEIAQGLGVSPSWVSVNLPAIAAETGFVERVDGTNRWRLGVPFVRISTTTAVELGKSQRRLAELSDRYAVPL